MTAHHDEPVRPLSPRMLEIAELVAARQSNEQIAKALGISASTVKNRITAMMMLFTNPDQLRARDVLRLYIERRRQKLAQG